VWDGEDSSSIVRIAMWVFSFLPLEWGNMEWGEIFEKYLEGEREKSENIL